LTAKSFKSVYGRQRSDLQPSATLNVFEAAATGSTVHQHNNSNVLDVTAQLSQIQGEQIKPWDLAPVRKLSIVVAEVVQLDAMVRYSQLACENYTGNKTWQKLTESRLHARVRMLALEKIIHGRKHPRVAAAQCLVAEAYGDNALWTQAYTHANDCISMLTACGIIDGSGQLVRGAYQAFDMPVLMQISQLHRFFADMCSAYNSTNVSESNEGSVLQMAMSRQDLVKCLADQHLSEQFIDGENPIHRVLSGQSCAYDVLCSPGQPDVDPNDRLDWIAFVEVLREADIPEYTQHLQALEGAFMASRLAVLRQVFQKASGVQAAEAAGDDEVMLLQDFPHVDDLTMLLRSSSRAQSFLRLDDLCIQLEGLAESSGNGGLLCWELFLECCHAKQQCHYVEETYHTALRLLGESHTMHRRLKPAREAVVAAATFLKESVGEHHPHCIPIYSALAALALVEAQTIAKQNLAIATRNQKKYLESKKARQKN
jgi:hypothetical protein